MPTKEASQALRQSPPVSIHDNSANLREDLKFYLKSIPSSFLDKEITYQNQSWSGKEIFLAYQGLLSFLRSYPNQEQLQKYIEDHFSFYEVYGDRAWGQVFVTSYFEPYYQGSLLKRKGFSAPALKVPNDLVQVNLKDFAEVHPQLSPHLDYILNEEKGPRSLTGRLTNKRVVPYYSRKEINQKANPKNAIVWLDPIDLFFLQIQGSGTIRLQNGKEITIGYAAQNGHEYVAIGKFLTDYIPLKEMTADKIEDFLRNQSKELQEKIMNKNPSYVFFSKRQGRPTTSMGTEVIDQRTIATDSYYFEKGLIGYLEVPHPEKDETIQKIVFNQDSGGAIRGPGRVDYFWGKGKEAGRLAGRMKHRGKLWFFLPKRH